MNAPPASVILLACCALLLTAAPVNAQASGRIAGVVVEAGSRRPLAHARVTASEARVGTITAQDGTFVLGALPPGTARLRVQLIGYAPAERELAVRAGSTTDASFELTPVGLPLDAVVVTGTAGSARLREVGHSVAQVDVERIPETIASVDHLLTARVPGLSAVTNSGMSGSGAQIRLRGNTSIALSNQPLVYVDGVRVRSEGYPKNAPLAGDPRRGVNDVASPINDINVADIERVEVVKGPAATTLYGAEAATGVLQIFTRRGSSGDPVWTAQVEHGLDRVQKFGTRDEPYMRLDPWLRTAHRQRYALSVAGGGQLHYYLSSSFDDNDGVLPNDWEKRVTLRGNFDLEPIPSLQLRWSSSYTNHDISNTPAGPNSQGITMNAYRGPRNFLGDTTKAALDRILDWEIFTYIDHLIGGLTAEYVLAPGITQRVTVGYDRATSEMRQLRPYGFVFQPGGVLSNVRWESAATSLEYVGSWERSLGSSLRSTITWGGERVATASSSVSGYAEGFPGPGEPTLSSGAIRLSAEDRSRIVTAGVFGQVLVGFRDRYFFTAGLRVDGSSSFGGERGWEQYPRATLSYVISEEPFWPAALGGMKLRASYGHAGRAPGPFDALRSWSAVSFGGEPAFVPHAAGDPDLGAERTRELEVGFDGSWLGGRLTADFTYYDQRTSDALFPVTQIPSQGFLGTQLQNVGTLSNRGVELSLLGTVVRRPRFGWDVGLSLATNHSKILDLGGAPSFVTGEVGWIIAGQPAPVLRGPRIRNPDEVAAPVIDNDHIYGPNLPTHTIGLSSTVRLPRGIEVGARGEYVGGHYTFDHASSHLARAGAWPVCDAAYDRIAAGSAAQLTAWERVWCISSNAPREGPIYPADFFRLRTLVLSVPMPGVLPGARSATMTLSGRNLWTWKNPDVLAFHPEMVGRDGMHSTVRAIEMHVPSPATVTIAVRAIY